MRSRRERDGQRTLDAGDGLRDQTVRLSDTRTVRTVVAGIGDPLVAFEGGIAVCASMWVTVQRLVAEQARTLAYDRAGCGGSDKDPRPRSAQRIADDLAAVLDAANERTPAVLVGASLGAPILHQSRPADAGSVRQEHHRHGMREAGEIGRLPTLRRLLADLPEVPVTALVGERADRGGAKGGQRW